MTIRQTAIGCLLIALAVFFGTGCGDSGGSNTAGAEEAVLGYLKDFAAGDGRGACGRLSSEEAGRLFEQLAVGIPELRATSCADAISKLTGSLGAEDREALETAEIETARVDGDRAEVKIAGATETARLRKLGGGGWVIVGGVGTP